MVDLHSEVMEIEEDNQKGKFLIFSLGREEYGLEIRYVTEIIGLQTITEVPELPVYIKGIINLRGKIIPVMDVRLRFKKEPREYNDRTCVVVINVNEIGLGLIVDGVTDVLSISDQNLAPPPQINKDFNNRFIKAIGKMGDSVKLVVDCDKLLNEEEIKELEAL